MKGLVYKNNSQWTPEVKDESIRVISENEPESGQNVIGYFNKKVDVCRAARREHLADIIFHTKISYLLRIQRI